MSWSAAAADAQLHLRREGAGLALTVNGAADEEWRFQFSDRLLKWTNAPALGAVFSSPDSPRVVPLGLTSAPQRLYRAVRTSGLYDPAVMRAVSLVFTQANWQQLLVANYSTGSNLVGNLVLDGVSYPGVGVHYKGNTSYSRSGVKKSLNITVDYTNATQQVRGYETLNLNNAWGDQTLMREALYFNVLQEYTVGPKAGFAKLTINGEYWGVYSFPQQENGDLLNEWFPSNEGDRWKAPSGTGSGGNALAGGGFVSGDRALKYLGTNLANYQRLYELKTQNSTNAWEHLYHVIDVLNNSPTNGLWERLEEVMAVDRWLWFLAIENAFTDDDSYWNKGADYEIYWEPESQRLHPIEHDGNEAFMLGDVQLSPFHQLGNTNRPVITRLLGVPELRQRYLAHLRTLLQERFNTTYLNPLLDQHAALLAPDLERDTKKGFIMSTFTNDVYTLRTFIQQRSDFLRLQPEIRAFPPTIAGVSPPSPNAPFPNQTAVITAQVLPYATEGIHSVWLYYRAGAAGKFNRVPMLDDGSNGDALSGDQVFTAIIPPFPAGNRVRYYVEARSGNASRTAVFAPPRAEQDTFSYRVALTNASTTPVVINELMANNVSTLADPQGEFDDWLELYNRTDAEVDLTGRYLSDEPNNPRKWAFPEGTLIPPHGYLLVWADENGSAPVGLHASFKLSASGEEVYLADTDENLNAILDRVIFGPQEADRSYGRTGTERFDSLSPTPGAPNP